MPANICCKLSELQNLTWEKKKIKFEQIKSHQKLSHKTALVMCLLVVKKFFSCVPQLYEIDLLCDALFLSDIRPNQN